MDITLTSPSESSQNTEKETSVKDKTLSDFLKENVAKGIIDFHLRASYDNVGNLTFYIHAVGHDSETLDFWSEGNRLLARPSIKPKTKTHIGKDLAHKGVHKIADVKGGGFVLHTEGKNLVYFPEEIIHLP